MVASPHLLESRAILPANATWTLLRSSPVQVAGHLDLWLVAVGLCLLPILLYCVMCAQGCAIAARRRGYLCCGSIPPLPPRSKSIIESKMYFGLLMCICAGAAVMSIYLVEAAHWLGNARCRALDALLGLVQGGRGPLWQRGFDGLTAELEPLGLEALVASNGTAPALARTDPFVVPFVTQLNKTLEAQKVFSENMVWCEHRCLFCEQASSALEGYAAYLLEGPPGLLQSIREAAAQSATEAVHVAEVSYSLSASVSLLGNWISAGHENTIAWPFSGSGELLTFLSSICGGILASIFVTVLAAGVLRIWLFSRYESLQEALGGVENEVAQDHKFLSTGGQASKAQVAWPVKSPLEGFGSLLLIHSSGGIWVTAGGVSVILAILGSLCIAAGVISRDMLTSHMFTGHISYYNNTSYEAQNLQGLSAMLWAEAAARLRGEDQALDVLWTCLRDRNDLRVFDAYWPFGFAGRLSSKNLTIIAERHAMTEDVLASLAADADHTRGLSGANFIHQDASGFLPEALSTSSASRTTQVQNDTVIPGMWEFLEVLNRMTGDTPEWSFTSLDGHWKGCPTKSSPCRFITGQEPTHSQVLQSYGSATYAEMFRVARLKEHVWNRALGEGSASTLQTWAAKAMAELDIGHVRLVEALGFGVLRQATVESIHDLWGGPVQRVERAKSAAGDCSWFAQDLEQSTKDGIVAAELLLVSGISSCCVGLVLSILACTAHSLWRRARHRSDNEALDAVLKRRALGAFATTTPVPPMPVKKAPDVVKDAKKEASESKGGCCRCFQRRSHKEDAPPAPPTPFGGKDKNAVMPFK